MIFLIKKHFFHHQEILLYKYFFLIRNIYPIYLCISFYKIFDQLIIIIANGCTNNNDSPSIRTSFLDNKHLTRKQSIFEYHPFAASKPRNSNNIKYNLIIFFRSVQPSLGGMAQQTENHR